MSERGDSKCGKTHSAKVPTSFTMRAEVFSSHTWRSGTANQPKVEVNMNQTDIMVLRTDTES